MVRWRERPRQRQGCAEFRLFEPVPLPPQVFILIIDAFFPNPTNKMALYAQLQNEQGLICDILVPLAGLNFPHGDLSSIALAVLEGCAAVQLQRRDRVSGAIKDLKRGKTGEVESRQLVVSAIQNTQSGQAANIETGELVIVGIDGLEFCQASQSEIGQLVEATIQILEAGQSGDVQVSKMIPVAIEVDNSTVGSCVFVAGTRPK
jgi:hypothetical protein